MAVKKKKKGTKKKKKVEKNPDDEDEEKCPIEFPEFQDPDVITQRAKLKVQLAAPVVPHLTFQVEVMITARVEEIRQMIIDRHDGAVQDIIICNG